MPRPWPHCVRWGPSSPFPHICCDQMAGWIKMPLGKEIGLSPGDIVLGGDPAPPLEKGDSFPSLEKGAQPPNFWPMSIVAKRLDGLAIPLSCSDPRQVTHMRRAKQHKLVQAKYDQAGQYKETKPGFCFSCLCCVTMSLSFASISLRLVA